MPPRRIAPLEHAAILNADGHSVPARPGEPVAVALAAAGRLVLGRSVKYHRPRGAACYSGKCDGCLMRVDGVPNVMTCRVPARDGMVVETQNVVGSAERDLLAATDWLFPHGMDHHHMFTRYRSVNRVMQGVARRLAGVGRLPDEPAAPYALVEQSTDVLVVGAGAAGLAAAAECASAGVRVLVVEESEAVGGALGIYPGDVVDESGSRVRAKDLAARLTREAAESGAEVQMGASCVGVFGDEGVAVNTGAGLVVVRASCLVVASGEHEGVVAVPGGDLPGVVGARAACELLRWGVVAGESLAILGEGPWADAVADAVVRAGSQVRARCRVGEVLRIRGRHGVEGIEIARDDGSCDIACDAVITAAPTSGAYELAAQAGAAVRFAGDGFEVVASAQGATAAPRAWATGGCAGIRSAVQAIEHARATGRAVAAELARG